VTGGADKVQTNMYPRIVVRVQNTFDFQLFLQVRFELVVYVIDDSVVAFFFVYLIAVSDRIHDCQLKNNNSRRQ
jgi:hypothetical protein